MILSSTLLIFDTSPALNVQLIEVVSTAAEVLPLTVCAFVGSSFLNLAVWRGFPAVRERWGREREEREGGRKVEAPERNVKRGDTEEKEGGGGDEGYGGREREEEREEEGGLERGTRIE